MKSENVVHILVIIFLVIGIAGCSDNNKSTVSCDKKTTDVVANNKVTTNSNSVQMMDRFLGKWEKQTRPKALTINKFIAVLGDPNDRFEMPYMISGDKILLTYKNSAYIGKISEDGNNICFYTPDNYAYEQSDLAGDYKKVDKLNN